MTSPEPPRIWTIPRMSGDPLTIDVSPGRVVVVVGPNGAGKSSLAQHLMGEAAGRPVHRMLGHRLVSFDGSGTSLSARSREEHTGYLTTWDRKPQSRYRDEGAGARANVVLFDLAARISFANAQFVAAEREARETGENATIPLTPLDQLNEVLLASGLGLSLRIKESSGFEAVREGAAAPYPIDHMSDGERAAVLAAASVLVAPEGAIQIIDEPERHLHRSISSPLLRHLFGLRSDCTFALFTHDLRFAAELDNQVTTRVVLRACALPPGSAWEADELELGEDVPPSVVEAVLGGRAKCVFVEGTKASEDAALYPIVLTDWTVAPVDGGCPEVERVVKGLRASHAMAEHLLEPHGLVDRDRRSPEQRAALEAAGVHVLEVSEVENIYYHPEVIRALAIRQGEMLGRDPEVLEREAFDAAIASIDENARKHLASWVAGQDLRRDVVGQVPPARDLLSLGDINIALSNPTGSILDQLTSLLASRDLGALLAEFPVRDTPLPRHVAAALQFSSPVTYKQAVRAAARLDENLRVTIRSLTGL